MFSIEEIDLLIDSLREYDVDPRQFVSEVLDSIVMLSTNPEELIEKLNSKSGEIKGLVKAKKEQIVLLQAKLIKLKGKIEANEAIDYTRGNSDEL